MTKNKTLPISFRSSIPKWIGKVPFWHVIQSLLQKTVAHPLFCNEMLGSKWIAYDELEKIYNHYEILKPGETAMIYAQDFARKNR